jgi:hypothetical protein
MHYGLKLKHLSRLSAVDHGSKLAAMELPPWVVPSARAALRAAEEEVERREAFLQSLKDKFLDEYGMVEGEGERKYWREAKLKGAFEELGVALRAWSELQYAVHQAEEADRRAERTAEVEVEDGDMSGEGGGRS